MLRSLSVLLVVLVVAAANPAVFVFAPRFGNQLNRSNSYDILDLDQRLCHSLAVVDLELILIFDRRGRQREGVGVILAIIIEGRRDGGSRSVFPG